MIDPLEAIDTIGKNIDRLTESEQDRQATLTERHKLDMTSPFKLPHFIRPISTLYSGLIWGVSIIWVLSMANDLIKQVGIKEASVMIMSPDSIIMYILGATTSMYLTHVGFYFNSRRNEKVNAKKVEAAIKIEAIKARSTAEQTKATLKLELKEEEIYLTNKKRVDRINRRRLKKGKDPL